MSKSSKRRVDNRGRQKRHALWHYVDVVRMYVAPVLIVVSVALFYDVVVYQPREARPWSTDPHYSFLDNATCTIERLSPAELTHARFRSEYEGKKPFIVSDYASRMPPGVWERIRSATERAALLSAHGDDAVTLSSGNSYSHGRQESTLRAYLHGLSPQPLERAGNETWYLFGDPHFHEWKDLLAAYLRVPSTLAPGETALSFGIAASGSGVPFHVHGAVFAEVFHGRKRWWITPPGHAPTFDPDASSLQWLRETYSRLPQEDRAVMTECVCEPGDLLYIPADWYHATLNIGETVFMSTFL